MKNVIVEVTINNLKDKKYYNRELEITRNGEKKVIIQKLLQKGDTFETDYDHAQYLVKLNVAKIIETKKSREE